MLWRPFGRSHCSRPVRELCLAICVYRDDPTLSIDTTRYCGLFYFTTGLFGTLKSNSRYAAPVLKGYYLHWGSHYLTATMSVWIQDGEALRATQDTPDSPVFTPASPATAVSLDAFESGSQSPMGLDDTIVACMQTATTEYRDDCNTAGLPSSLRDLSTYDRSRHPSASALGPELDDQLGPPVDSTGAEVEPAWWKRTRHDVTLNGTYLRICLGSQNLCCYSSCTLAGRLCRMRHGRWKVCDHLAHCGLHPPTCIRDNPS